MNGQAQLGRNKEFVLSASTGLLSGFLYLSYVLSFTFLVPVQGAFAGRGRRSGLIAAATALIVIAAGHGLRMIEMRVLEPMTLLSGVIPPALLLVALCFINLPTRRLSRGIKILVAVLALSALAAPFVIKATSDEEFLSLLTDYVGSAIRGSGIGNEGLGIAKEAVNDAVGVMRSAFAAFILWILAGSWWLGSYAAARKALREGRADENLSSPLRLMNIRVPAIALWPTLLSWALLFGVLVTKRGGIEAAVIWNLALCGASLYAMQGIGILSYLFKRFDVPRALRLLAPPAVAAIALSSTAGAFILIALPLLGITEVWLPYRNLKGALK